MRFYWLILLVGFLLACTDSDVPETAVPPQTPLSGRLIFSQLQANELALMQYDLASKSRTPLFIVPDRAWLSFAQAIPDGSQLVLAYAPPPPAGQIQFGYTKLHLMPPEAGAEPQPLNLESQPDEIFFEPIWSADGRYLIYAHILPLDSSGSYTFQLQRLDTQSGEISLLTTDAIWPRLSADGTKLAYVYVHPSTSANELIIADADGRNPITLIASDRFLAVDVPFFSPDGSTVYFSAVDLTTTALSWWDRLLGVQTAVAHDLPSDWWRIPATGGQPERIADIDEIGLHGAFSPDGQLIAYISNTGLYLMNPDGTNRQQLLAINALNGLSWIP